MANPRKVQSEIDKLLKKVQEGMDVYEDTFEKVNSAPDKVQKEKFEAELKKEIKKLQRLREQIKNLHASPEVKDKKQLEVTRRAIEVKMEGFKVCERETKTKAFSKEGLAATKSDPAAKAKAKTVGWINQAIQDLQDQTEQIEFDIENEGIQKKKKGEDERETRMKRNQYHILKLESVLRQLENGDLEPEDVDEIETDVQAFVEGYQDPNYNEDDGMDPYEMFDLPEGMVQAIGSTAAKEDEEEEAAPAAAAAAAAAAKSSKGGVKDTPPTAKAAPKLAAASTPAAAAPSKKVEAAPAATAKAGTKQPTSTTVPEKKPATSTTPLVASSGPLGSGSSAAAAAPIAPIAATPKTPITPLAAGGKGPASPGIATKSMAAMLRDDKQQSTAAAAGKRDGFATAPLGAAAAAPTAAAASGVAAAADGLGDEELDGMNDDTFGDDAMEGVTPGAGSIADMASLTTKQLGGGDWAKPLPATVAGSKAAIASAANVLSSAPKLPPAQPGTQQQQLAAPQQPAAAKLPASPSSSSTPYPTGAPAATAPAAATPAKNPGAAAPSMNKSDVIQRMLAMSLRNLPHTSDCERPKPYSAPNPYETPSFYPQTVLPNFNVSETYTRFDVDTLFFIFYYQQAGYQQYLAAKELKRQSWRFHKKFQTWFQRHDRPKNTTEEQEQGTYIYFDYDGGWCQRIKQDFVFRYAHLEDSLQ